MAIKPAPPPPSEIPPSAPIGDGYSGPDLLASILLAIIGWGFVFGAVMFISLVVFG